LILIMNKTKAVRHASLLFCFLLHNVTGSLILQFFSKIYMIM